MEVTRETIYAALFAKLQTVAGFNTVSRRLRHWSDVSPADQPALFMAQKDESVETVTRLPGKWMFRVDLYLYANSTDESQSPSQVLNPLLDAITNLFAGNPVSNVETLGGLVEYARVSGTIETDEGLLGDQAVAIIPLEILTA